MSWQAPGYAHRLDLGGGNTGRAVLALHEETGDLVVIRFLTVESSYFERVRTEISELSTVESRYFVGIRDVIEQEQGIALVTDAINGVNLRHILRDVGAIRAEAALLVYYESLSGLSAAHGAGVTHGDYRPENLMVDTSGATYMIDARAASWVERDITLSTGVYLAPERWRGEEITAAVDVYAATVTFVEMLVGEPPYWEDSQLIALRYRHEQEEIPAEGIPLQLRDIVRLGLAKDAAARAEAVALLELLDLTAVAEFGEDWAEVGRAALVELVAARNLAFSGPVGIEESEVVTAGELVELDDYYLEQSESGAAIVGGAAIGGAALAGAMIGDSGADASDEAEAVEVELVDVELVDVEAVSVETDEVLAVAGGAAGAEEAELTEVDVVALEDESSESDSLAAGLAEAEIIAAAAEIVELARIEEMAAAELLASAEEDVLTEEEERAVAEVSEIVVAVEAEEAAVGVAAVGGTAIAATEAEMEEVEVVAAEGVVFDSVVVESEAAAGAFGEGSVAAGLIAEGAVAEAEEGSSTGAVIAAGAVPGVAVASAAAASAAAAGFGVAIAEQGGSAAVGTASVPGEGVAVGIAAVPFHRRHPWLTGIIALFIIILCAGGALAMTGGLAGGPGDHQTPVAALSDTPTTQGGVIGGVSPSPSEMASAGVPVTSPTPGESSGGTATSTSTSTATSTATATSTSTKTKTKKPKPTPSVTKLPVTGSGSGRLFAGAGVLLLLGVGLVVIARRRRA